LTALESYQLDQSYHEDVALWSFNEAGELLDHRMVREDINHVPGDFAPTFESKKTTTPSMCFQLGWIQATPSRLKW
jgi:hypothetical protein